MHYCTKIHECVMINYGVKINQGITLSGFYQVYYPKVSILYNIPRIYHVYFSWF